MLASSSGQLTQMWKNFRYSTFFRGDHDIPLGSMEEACHYKFSTVFNDLVKAGSNEYDLDRASTAIFYLRSLLERNSLGGSAKVCVEVGCGIGTKGLAIQDLFGSYIGIDTQEDQVEIAANRAKRLGIQNSTFISGNAVDVLKKPGDNNLPATIDFLLLYAVVEHLTPVERLEILSLANRVIAEGGKVMIMETPNRLMAFDSHTYGAHFLNWLPDELAYSVAQKLPKAKNFKDFDMPWDPPSSVHNLYRAGRGVSYHEFSAGLNKDVASYGFPVNSYSLESLLIDPLQMQELHMFGYLERNLPEVSKSFFSRSWIEGVITKDSKDSVDTHFLSPYWPKWLVFDSPPLFWERPTIELNSTNSHWEAHPNYESGGEIILMFSSEAATIKVWLNDDLVDEIDAFTIQMHKPLRYHKVNAVSYTTREEIKSIMIGVAAGNILFHGAIVHRPIV